MTYKEISQLNEQIRRDKNYPEIYQKAVLKLREMKFKPYLPGHGMLLKSICANRILGLENEELYSFVEATTLIPHFPKSKEDTAHVAEMLMKESLEVVNLNTNPMSFIREVEL